MSSVSSSVHLLVSTHSNDPNVIRPCASSSKSFCCMKYIFVIPRLCGSVYDPSSEYHLFSMTSQLHDWFGSAHVLSTEQGQAPLDKEENKNKIRIYILYMCVLKYIINNYLIDFFTVTFLIYCWIIVSICRWIVFVLYMESRISISLIWTLLRVFTFLLLLPLLSSKSKLILK